MNGAHSYLCKVSACIQVAAQRGLVPRSVSFPRKPRSTVLRTYRLAEDYGDCMVLCYQLSRDTRDPELWAPVAGLRPELGVCIDAYRAAQAAERQQERADVALDALEGRLRHAATVPDI